MICYRDMTFCSFHEDCKNGEGCPRAYTDEVRQGAIEWSGTIRGEPPVAFFMDKPECFVEKVK